MLSLRKLSPLLVLSLALAGAVFAPRGFGADGACAPRFAALNEPHVLSFEDILAAARQPKGSGMPYRASWDNLFAPFFGDRPRGLRALHRIADREGLYVVMHGNRPASKAELNKIRDFCGCEPLFEGDFAGKYLPVEGKGLVLHTSYIDDGPYLMNFYRGSANPHVGYGYLHGLLEDNKLAEYRLADKVMPGSMAKTETYQELVKNGGISAEAEGLRRKLRAEVEDILSAGRPLGPPEKADLERKVRTLADGYLQDLRKRYPMGAFVKNYGEFGTADMGIQITTKSEPEAIASQYVNTIERVLANGTRGNIDDGWVGQAITANGVETGTKFMHALLKDPHEMLSQARIKIAKTPQGANREFRVDFIDGEPATSYPRFSNEYNYEDLQESKKMIKDFFARAPKEFRYLSGGADVARLEDGSWVIIEFNSGASSGTLMPHITPVLTHEYMTAVGGKPTKFMARLQKALEKSPEKQREFLKSFADEEIRSKRSLDDVSKSEVGNWLREQHLTRWRENKPTRKSADRLLRDLETIFGSENGPAAAEYKKLLDDSRAYIESYLTGQKK